MHQTGISNATILRRAGCARHLVNSYAPGVPLIVARVLAGIFLSALLPWISIANETITVNEQLIGAVAGGDLARVKFLLEKGAHVEAKDGFGMTALLWASDKGHLDTVKFLLAKGADIGARNNSGMTALMKACVNVHADLMSLLLDKGVDVNAAAYFDGRTALMAASEEGHLAVVRLLMQKGANVNAMTNEGSTALIGF